MLSLLHWFLRSLSISFLETPIATINPNYAQKNLIIDTDLFSDVDDAGAILLTSTLPQSNILALLTSAPSRYTPLAASALLAHYNPTTYRSIPIGFRQPLTNATFFDSWSYSLGEYASKVAFHWRGGSIAWDDVEAAERAVDVYRRTLAAQEDGSVTIVVIGFLSNLWELMRSSADKYSDLNGQELIKNKVRELVVMGGEYPRGREFNFYGDEPWKTAEVVNTWTAQNLTPITFSGFEMGVSVFSGARLTVEGPENDPVAAAYRWFTGYNKSRESWDPLTMLYAVQGLGEMFEYGNECGCGYNNVFPNGSNEWVFDEKSTSQKWLKLKVGNADAGKELDRLFLAGADSVVGKR
ncbi:inosine/uridine-preferring nucleoside hydrolase [Aulographum hederae CBS 113979]|uniref:Inosine/uridine-preferring nucleoside hydrolase n=1 Tax=Aulographum hederae CBS 113979 TaxID=1176131 RepID=A0A6G1GL66_9PEZI|nr:inosine/uridine-preferring nucleoside hydrolase [Aulographum hederae CBS 113979]